MVGQKQISKWQKTDINDNKLTTQSNTSTLQGRSLNWNVRLILWKRCHETLYKREFVDSRESYRDKVVATFMTNVM
jgi:hypothetical protein